MDELKIKNAAHELLLAEINLNAAHKSFATVKKMLKTRHDIVTVKRHELDKLCNEADLDTDEFYNQYRGNYE